MQSFYAEIMPREGVRYARPSDAAIAFASGEEFVVAPPTLGMGLPCTISQFQPGTQVVINYTPHETVVVKPSQCRYLFFGSDQQDHRCNKAAVGFYCRECQVMLMDRRDEQLRKEAAKSAAAREATGDPVAKLRQLLHQLSYEERSALHKIIRDGT